MVTYPNGKKASWNDVVVNTYIREKDRDQEKREEWNIDKIEYYKQSNNGGLYTGRKEYLFKNMKEDEDFISVNEM